MNILNIKNIYRFMRIIVPWALVLSVLLFITANYYALIASPADMVQGEIARIMYIHVPAAWIALGCYLVIALLGISVLVWSNVIAGILARAIAPLGLIFSVICLVTGSIWGEGTWGTWWVWDARLTSMLFLVFLYVGYIALWKTMDEQRAMKVASIFGIISAINIPIIKFSVDFWQTLHQPASILRSGGISIAAEMLVPLMLMFLFFVIIFFLLAVLRFKTLISVRQIRIKIAMHY